MHQEPRGARLCDVGQRKRLGVLAGYTTPPLVPTQMAPRSYPIIFAKTFPAPYAIEGGCVYKIKGHTYHVSVPILVLFIRPARKVS